MATLAVVEFLGRHGEVVRRELLERLPVELGRAYDNDIVLDDPYVAARHLRIAAAPDGFLLTDLGSRNGMRAIGSKRSANRLEVDAETVVRLGHTQLRVRSASYALPEELPIKPERPYRRALLFLATLLASLAYFGLCDYLDSYQPLDWGLLGSVMAVFLGGLLLWLGVWSSMSRVISGSANFALHGISATLGFVGVDFAMRLADYLAFAFSWELLARYSSVVAGVAFAILVFAHLSLVGRNAVPRSAVARTLLAGLLVGSVWGVQLAGDARQNRLVRQYVDLQPPFLLATGGITPEELFGRLDQLRLQAEQGRNDW